MCSINNWKFCSIIHMGSIPEEIKEVKNQFENNRIEFSKLITCNPNHIRVEIS